MAIYEVKIESSFKASHAVRDGDGKFEPAHEHDWQVSAKFRSGKLNDAGMVVDFLVVKAAMDEIFAELKGINLNAIAGLPTTGATAELLAREIAMRLSSALDDEATLYCVKVCEAPGCSAAFFPDGTI